MSKHNLEYESQSRTTTRIRKPSRFKSNSLDSDEEDAEEFTEAEERVLNPDDIQGQEEGEVDFKDGIKITPFNMHEELEEGHFDSEGMYIFDKDEEIRDSWLENIDWVKVKEREVIHEDSFGNDSESNIDDFDEIDSYKKMLEIMRPAETVLKAIRRLGGGKAKQSSLQRWKAKRKKLSACSEGENKDLDIMRALTALADGLLQRGNMEIYEATYEKLTYMVQAVGKDMVKKQEGAYLQDADKGLDMFGEEFDEKVEQEGKQKSANQKEDSKDSADASVDEQKWEYKWELTDDAEIHGPFTTKQMLQWSESDFFKDGCFVRKANTEGQFYSSRRIDFELYM